MLIFFFFQYYKNIGIIGKEDHLPWDLDPKETKKFETTWSNTYEYYQRKIRRRKERGQNVSIEEQKLKSEHFLCPTLFPCILGGIVPCRRKNARKLT